MRKVQSFKVCKQAPAILILGELYINLFYCTDKVQQKKLWC